MKKIVALLVMLASSLSNLAASDPYQQRYWLRCDDILAYTPHFFYREPVAFFQGSYVLEEGRQAFLRDFEAAVIDRKVDVYTAVSGQQVGVDTTFKPRIYKDYQRFRLKDLEQDNYFYLLLPKTQNLMEARSVNGPFAIEAIVDVRTTDQGGDYLKLSCLAWKS